MQKLGLEINSPSEYRIKGIRGWVYPLGIISQLFVTIGTITLPIKVHILEDSNYNAVFENNCLLNIQSNIRYSLDGAHLSISWKEQKTTVEAHHTKPLQIEMEEEEELADKSDLSLNVMQTQLPSHKLQDRKKW